MSEQNSQILSYLQEGMSLHQNGKLNEAKLIYERVLEIQPNNFDALRLLGVLTTQTQQFSLSVELLSKALKIDPNHLVCNYYIGLAFHELQHFEDAILSYQKALLIKPDFVEAYYSRANAFQELHRYHEAISDYEKAVHIKADFAEAYSNHGNSLQKLKRFEEALISYDKAISIKGDYSEAYYNRAYTLGELKRFEEAVSSYDKAIKISPNFVLAYYNRGNALYELKRFEEAITSHENAIAIEPDFVLAHTNRGNALYQLKHFEEALVSYDKALSLNSDFAEAYLNRGNTLKELNRKEEALVSYYKAINIKSDFAEAHFNCGNILLELKRFEDALLSYYKAISIQSDHAKALFNCGNIFVQLRRFGEALVNYDKAIKISPNDLEPYINRGVALQELNRYEEALACYDKAISIKTNSVIAHYCRASILQLLRRLDEAFDSYHQAIRYESENSYLIGDLQHLNMLMCNWDQFHEMQNQIIEKVNSGIKVCVPFEFLALIDDPLAHKICSQIYIKESYPYDNSLGSITKRSRQKKIRIGYYSADFNHHAVSFLTAELFELHNKEQFEIIAFYFGPEAKDELHIRLTQSFDQFIYIRSMSDLEVAKLSRKLQIDIAIDLGGYTKNHRTGIFSYRAAPLQLSYIGYLGTMGVEYFDYLIADTTIIPEGSEHYYSEKILYLPSYQVNDRKRKISEKAFTRQELGLPEEGFVFCCFNNNYKILPTTFDSWMRILNAVEGSVLFLYADNQWAEQNLKKEAIARGVEPKRLVFGKSIAREEYLARYKCCDLFIDTIPYNAGTTASDALWAGLPVLTLQGESFASRVASSILNAIHLPELITSSQEEYEALAIELATNTSKLRLIKEKLINNRLTTPLFDTPLFTKHIEDAYIQIMERYWTDLKPEHIYVSQQ